MYAKERIYKLDAQGEPAFLLYAEGDEIPDDEAQALGLVDGKVPTAGAKKIQADAVENKAVKPATKKTASKE